MTFLGIQLNTVAMTMEITPNRLVEIKEELHQWVAKTRATKRELQSLIGKLSFIAKCVKPGRLFLARMLELLRSAKYSHYHIYLNTGFRADLKWWIQFLDVYNGVYMINNSMWSHPDEICDACPTGGGGLCDNQYFHCEFPQYIQVNDLHLNALELLAITIAVKLWGSQWSGMRIQVLCDNQATVWVINTGRARDKFMLACLRELWLVAATYEFELRAVHIAGTENRLADVLSRWHLHPNYEREFKSKVNADNMAERHVTDAHVKFLNEWLLDMSCPGDVTLWAAILLGFFSFFCKSNLVPKSIQDFDPSKHLCRGKIVVSDFGLVVGVT
ncbi:uncharacterized protein LOC144439750 [Glandiceps talaboti]